MFIGRQDRVMVVDQDGTLLGEVTGIKGAHGTALAPDTGHGFATSGDDKSVVMFDLKTFKALGRIPAAEDADAIIFDPASKRVFTFNGDAHSSTVIDPQAGTLVTNVRWAASPNTARRPATARSTQPDGHQRSRRDRREDGDGVSTVVNRAVQAARVDGGRPRDHIGCSAAARSGV